MSGTKCIAIVVVGHVQGVGYRAWTKREAEARGLSGHVRNRGDGAVEATVRGPADAVDAMVRACRAGPPGARVARIDVAANPADIAGSGFAITR